jgi:uncharacterized membrane protein YfcA
LISRKKERLSRFNKGRFFSILGVLAIILGVYIASIIEDRLEGFVDAVLGLAVVYFLYLLFLSPKRMFHSPNENALQFPKDLGYLAYGFLFGAILFWAGNQILSFVLYLFFGVEK